MPLALLAALLVCLCLPAPAAAVMFGFSGTVETVTDPENLLDASVSDGSDPGNPNATEVNGTYEVDLTTASTSTPFVVGAAHLFFDLGNYRFDGNQSSHAIALLDDQDTGIPGVTVDHWQSREIALADLNPETHPSGNFAGYAAQIDFFDNDSVQFNGSETAPIVPSSVIGWEPTRRLTLNFLKLNEDGSTSFDPARLQVQVNITHWAEVPEARSAGLLAFGLASFALRARTRVR